VQPWRVRRVVVPEAISASFAHSTANYRVAFALTTGTAETRTALRWARAVFEESPSSVRRCLVFGWRRLLGLQLGARPSDDHVLGWAVADGVLMPASTALTAASRFLRASNIVAVEPSTVIWVTLVHYSHPAARPLWALARPAHHLAMRLLLARAARAATLAASPSGRAA
jgi:hypothetical protein